MIYVVLGSLVAKLNSQSPTQRGGAYLDMIVSMNIVYETKPG